jgi:hypothetical protein
LRPLVLGSFRLPMRAAIIAGALWQVAGLARLSPNV